GGEQRRDPQHAGGQLAQQIGFRPDAERKETDHDDEEKQRRDDVRLPPHGQFEIAADYRADDLEHQEIRNSRTLPAGMVTSWWVVMTARPPRCRWPEMMPASQSTAPTSSATKGSSSIHKGRFSLTRRARATRRFWPCERYLQARSSRPARPTCSSASMASSSESSSSASRAAASRFSSGVNSSLMAFR